MKKSKTFVSVSFIAVILILAAKFSWGQAQANGEIININYQYKIAFTDLTDYYLDVGDIVSIYQDGNLITYLKVSEATGVLSKLVPVEGGQYKTNVPFTDIKIGNKVVKNKSASTSAPSSNQPALPTPEPTGQTKAITQPAEQYYSGGDIQQKYDQLNQNYIILSNNLAKILNEKSLSDNERNQLKQELEAAIVRIKELEAKNNQLQKDLDEATISGNKATCYQNLKKMQQTMNNLKIKLQKISANVEGKIIANETR